MTIKTLSPTAVRELVADGAVLVDIRSAAEYAREHIAQARQITLDRLADGALAHEDMRAVVFYCRSGNRTGMNAQVLEACAQCETYVLEGGLDGWKKVGMPVVADSSQPIELQRQVQIVAGSIVLLGVVLGTTLSPWFLAVSGFVGAGLVFAGVTGFCGMACVLMRMPWNRRAALCASK